MLNKIVRISICDTSKVHTSILDAFVEVMNKNNLTSISYEGIEEIPSTVESMVSELSTKSSTDEPSDTTFSNNVSPMKLPILKFKSSVTLLPSSVTDMSTYSNVTSEFNLGYSISKDLGEKDMFEARNLSVYAMDRIEETNEDSSEFSKNFFDHNNFIKNVTNSVSIYATHLFYNRY